MRIPSSFLQDLLNRIDIIEVVARHVQLKKRGANFLGLCPFHDEKSPSFTVSAHKQFYHCFGCGAHGTVISFLMEHAGLSFLEAVNELAQSIGLSVPREASNSADSHEVNRGARANTELTNKLVDVLQQACEYYRKQLRETESAITYLKKRGLTGEIAARFGLGYAPSGWQNLQAAFADYREPALIQAGLVIPSDKMEGSSQRHYDRFRERIMFPIRNVRGQVIGFGGRVFEGGEPKYLNSPETPLFNKGSELYGLFEARAAIREKGYALVVEGYMDVVALAQLGFPNTVATLGTACTPYHVRILLRHTDTLIFSFDGDAAGQRAARRALENCLPYAADNRVIRFLFLPAEHDPDSYIREHGAQAFAEQAEAALPLSQLLLKEILSNKALDQPEGRAKALFDAQPLLQALPDNALRAQILQMLSARLNLPVLEVATLCKLESSRPRVRAASARSERPRVTGNEQRALRNLIVYPRLAGTLNEAEISMLVSETQSHELFSEVLAQAKALGNAADFKVLSDLLRNSTHAAAYDEICREILTYDENVRDLLLDRAESAAEIERHQQQESLAGEELRDAIVKLRHQALSKRRAHLCSKASLNTQETAELAELLRQTAALKSQAAALKK